MMLKAFTSLKKSVVDFLEYNYFRFLVDLNNMFHDKTVIELYFVFHFNYRFMFKTQNKKVKKKSFLKSKIIN